MINILTKLLSVADMITCLIILKLILTCSSEPHCSKFHYEEKLLEKMIRTEILVENMKKQIDDIETRVTGTLAKLNEDTVKWKGEIEAMQDNSNTSLQLLQEKAKSDLDKNMQEVQDLKAKVVSPKIAFNARNIKNRKPGAGDTIIFTDILLNLGDSYNTDTGVFTVPLGGIYLFTVQLCIYTSSYIDFGLVADNVYMDEARYRDDSGHICCYKLTTTVHIKSGTKVWVKVIYRTESGDTLYHNDAHYWTSFSGVLIHID
ncbi:heavy metal-binding protein HIP-like [Ruditapes philippinarum]|uniref:heavy metal-binding protein HIP-like n=1 Tax=Ruditapes philippinarum TaxID=129788 RepID=UPI00295B2E9D|nr:heavy metal-binding protein HIP-like [Ruditapes philippinarum]